METETKKDGDNGFSKSRRPMDQVVVREFPPVGKYKVRLVRKAEGDSRLYLDIREYAQGSSFEGFTRRGIRLSLADDVPRLRLALDAALEFLSAP
ncbi:MAG: hypothetical protein HY716_10520 [Planctomycetes bacterium]|nr:hypothetical protein [Planctomycetota bacterium]